MLDKEKNCIEIDGITICFEPSPPIDFANFHIVTNDSFEAVYIRLLEAITNKEILRLEPIIKDGEDFSKIIYKDDKLN